ncbi:hypothetical protein [Phaeovulum sp.]|uniref:hypothetical protein n=1 Tax=Phaeovulum sp. TaxID=2934796 RepID=UPI0027314016|nr:hypothetical protein [Phaeovulum sp.]MDP1670429.1 hypothetical protein [Phaeovulum sp.]MDP3861651.1 hypothetical protein [Phaeovulum sp.]MDZ4120754.1 hypothetical protein [Phaeovulum sp.]
MRRQLPYIAAAVAGFAMALALRASTLGDVGKVVAVGATAIAALYGVEYLLRRRR